MSSTDVSYKEVLCSSLGPETGYIDYEFSWYSLVTTGKCRDYLKLGHSQLISNPLEYLVFSHYAQKERDH
jgi:hypothetical protein